MKKQKHFLAGSAAALVVTVAAPAMAFDNTSWDWTVSATDTKTGNQTSTLNALPTGQATVDKMQVTVGNSDAQASADSQVTLPASIDPADGMTSLGTVEAAAAAYGNVSSDQSGVAINANIGQFHVGSIDPTVTVDPLAAGTTIATDGNANHVMAKTLMDQAATGLITPHQTTANADAVGVKDALVDVEARAVSNSSSLILAAEPAVPLDATALDPAAYPLVTDAMMTGDVTQFSLGDTAATALGSQQTIGNVSNLGTLDRPVMRATATSIGNLSAMSVTAKGGLTDSINP